MTNVTNVPKIPTTKSNEVLIDEYQTAVRKGTLRERCDARLALSKRLGAYERIRLAAEGSEANNRYLDEALNEFE
jgi:hypothetical protein